MEFIGLILLVAVIAIVLWAIGVYNSLVKMRNQIEEAWRQIDVELHRRYDLIPNLVETVRGYAAHEKGVFEAVTQARAAAAQPQPSLEARAAAENALTATIGRLFAVAEAYPELKANQNFLALQTELTNTEDRIANGRRYYNATVREYNTKTETFPSSIVASIFNFKRAAYFEAEGASRDVVSVDFGQGGGSVAGATQGGGWQAPPGQAGGQQNNPFNQQQTTAGPFGGPAAPSAPSANSQFAPPQAAPQVPPTQQQYPPYNPDVPSWQQPQVQPPVDVPPTQPVQPPVDPPQAPPVDQVAAPPSEDLPYELPQEDAPPAEPEPGPEDGPVQPGGEPYNPR